ncbi:21 kDa protein-like [Malania oleifera]|uniref:21 kDa protein-like n=1 Tax=Malania oleifera TaxID=397392 RepID=UPI0025AE7654|nr:21 kDa protein-like [Malania oleifera]
MAGSSFFQYYLLPALILLPFCAYKATPCLPLSASTPESNRNIAYIKKSCNDTIYPLLCNQILLVRADEIHCSPKMLAKISISIAHAASINVSKVVSAFQGRNNLTKEEAQAIEVCVEEVRDSVDELQKSIDSMGIEVGDPNFKTQMEGILSWVSAVLTDGETCTDAFEEKGANRDVSTTVVPQVDYLKQLASIALVFVRKYASANSHAHAN